jgi:hypothetical protein
MASKHAFSSHPAVPYFEAREHLLLEEIEDAATGSPKNSFDAQAAF